MHLVSPEDADLYRENADVRVLKLLQFFLENHPRKFHVDSRPVHHLKMQLMESQMARNNGVFLTALKVMPE